jgi:hypothetical protein
MWPTRGDWRVVAGWVNFTGKGKELEVADKRVYRISPKFIGFTIFILYKI